MTNPSVEFSRRYHRKMLPAFVLSALCLMFADAARAECDAPVASIVSIQGTVEVSAAGQVRWYPASVGQALCPGELVTVRKQSRAAVLFEGDVLTRLDQYTTLQVAAPPRNGDAALGLREGIAHVISRLKKRVEVIAPVVNALVEGTEFTVVARSGGARVVVDEGRVRVSNPAGETLLLAGQAADVSAGSAPTKLEVKPLDSVQWAIYYPLVVWPGDESLKEARALGVQAKYPQALAKIADDRSVAARDYRANLLLALGRFDDAAGALSDTGESKALESVIAIAQGRVAEARALVDEALAGSPESAAIRLATSYVSQAEGRLEDALDQARHATSLMPENPIAWARRAELELTLARIEEGRQSAAHAIELSPKTVRAKAMLGFALALAGQYGDAQAQLDAAIADNPADPLAHFALGLVLVRRGELAPGRRELEIAVLLDPSNVEYRSMLGRAYMAENRDSHAATQLDLATRLDPASPTPRFFEAQRLLTDGDVLGAIDAGQQALALNGNRLSLRSPELLATDKAARATTLGSAYQNAGFDSALKRVASDAVEADSASGPAHRLMGRAYDDDNRLESARVSEQFQSFVFGDMGQPMVMPQELVTAMPVLDGARAMSMHEAAALFGPKPYRFEATGLIGSQESWGTSVMASAGNQDLQASVGHFDYRSDGFSDTGEVDLSTTRAEFRGRLSDNAIVFADLQHKDTVAGDVTQSFFTQFDQEITRERSDLTRIGFRYRPSANMSFVLFGANESGQLASHTSSTSSTPMSSTTSTFDHERRFDRREVAGRFDWSYSTGNAVLGFRTSREKQDNSTLELQTGSVVVPLPPPFGPIVLPLPGVTLNTLERRDASQERLFADASHNLGSMMTVHGRANYVRYRDDSSLVGLDRRDSDRVLPSVGMTIRDLFGGEWRAAYIQDLTFGAPGGQSIEPTRFAGFDALFDDYDGTRYRRWALGVTKPLGSRATLGAEWSLRKADVPTFFCGSDECITWLDERRHGVYATFQATRSVGFETGWHYVSQRNREIDLSTFQPVFLRTETVPVRMLVQWPSNWRLMVEALRVRQDIDYVDNSLAFQRENSSFWLANLRLQYGAPGADWGVAMDVRNLFDQQVRVQETDLATMEARTPLWYPERSVMMTVYTRF